VNQGRLCLPSSTIRGNARFALAEADRGVAYGSECRRTGAARIRLPVQSIEALERSNISADIETHWSAFLTAAGRVFSELQQGAKVSASSKNWFGTKVGQRRSNPLLQYLWHARNAHGHAIIELTKYRPVVVKDALPTSQKIETLHRVMREDTLPCALIDVTPPEIRLLPVVDRCGTIYFPPPGIVPFVVGKRALRILNEILNEAESRMAYIYP
jgi:hypothetical protein